MRTITIGGHQIEVEVVDILIDAEGAIIYGQYLETDGRIQISRRSNALMSQTLIHEVTHAIDHVFNNGKLDEDTIDALAQGWYQILKGGDVFQALVKEKVK